MPDKLEQEAREKMAEANKKYLEAKAAGGSAEAELEALQTSIMMWEYHWEDENRDPGKVSPDASAPIKGAAQAALDFKSFHFIVFNTNTFATEETFAEDLAHMFFGDYGSLTEKEEEISPYASNHLKELAAKRQKAFKALREHYGIATAIDAAPQTPNDLFSGIAGDNPL